MFEELIKKRGEWELYELSDSQLSKMDGECRPGCPIKIYWAGEDKIIDDGYVFVAEGMDADIGDCFFHIPHPDNPGGKGNAPEEFGYMIELLTNSLVERIEFCTI